MDQQGIHIEIALNAMQRITGEVLHFLHLDSVGEAIFKGSHVLITVDGVVHERPMALVTFVEVPAGDHKVEVALKSALSPSAGLSRFYNGAAVDVTVPAAGAVRLRYSLDNIILPSGGNGNLEIVR